LDCMGGILERERKMPISSKLFKAILSMDSYNRGYEAGIKFGDLPDNISIDAPDTQLGNATIFDSSGDQDAQDISRYENGIWQGHSPIKSSIFYPD